MYGNLHYKERMSEKKERKKEGYSFCLLCAKLESKVNIVFK